MDTRYLAVDIGGTSIKYAYFRPDGEMLDKGKLRKTEKTMPQLVETISRLYHGSDGYIGGVGISANMVVNPVNGEAYGGSSYFWEGDSFPLREEVRRQCEGVSVSLDKDSNAALLAELTSGCLQGVKSAIAIILGTAIGMAFYLNGKIYYGDHYYAGEASTTMIGAPRPAAPLSVQSISQIIWSNYNGVPGFVHRVGKAIGREDLGGHEMFSMIGAGDQTVCAMFEEYCDILASQIMNLTLFLDIDHIAIGGGVSDQRILIEKVQDKLAEANSYLRPSANAPTPKVLQCKYRNDANLYGAFYSLQKQLKEERGGAR